MVHLQPLYHAFQQLIICLLIKTFLKEIGGMTTMNKVIELRAWKTNKVFQELQRERDFEREQSFINGDIRTLSEIIDMELKGLQHELEFLFQDKFYRLSFSGKDGVTYFNNIDNLNIKFYRNKYKKLERVSLIELFTDNEIVIYDKTWANEQIKFMFSRFGLEFFDTSIESENEKTETEMENLKTLSQLIIMIENGNLPKDKFFF